MQRISDDPTGDAPGPAPAADPGDGSRDEERFRGLESLSDPVEARRAWAELLARRLRVGAGAVLLGPPDSGPFTPIESWPAGGGLSPGARDVADRAIRQRTAVTEAESRDSLRPTIVAYPMLLSGRLHGVIVVEIPARTGVSPDTILSELHWSAGWLASILRAEGALGADGRGGRLESVLQMISAALDHERFQAAATAFCTEIALRLGCDRVCLGIEQKGRVLAVAMSHSAHFERKTNAVQAIEAAMEEAFDQEATLVHPPREDAAPLGLRAHAELAGAGSGGSVCSIPIVWEDRICAVLTLERPAGKRFDADAIEEAEAAADLAGPVLELRRREERAWLAKTVDACRSFGRRLFGPDQVSLKLSVLVIAGLVAFLALADGDYRVTAETTLEAAELRAAVAPFNGYVREAPKRAGDRVAEGERLALLDDRELLIERLKWGSEYEQAVKQAREALALQDAARVEVVSAAAAQSKAELDLVEDRLTRVEIRAPFDGIVVSGDLSQRLGAPVEQGDVLFEVAPISAHRVVLHVDEREIDEVRVGQRGELILASLPSEALPIEVARVTPVANVHEGMNRFRVEARLLTDDTRLRPGLEGVAKVGIDRRRLAWIWTHDAVDWLRLRLWSWLP